MGWVVLSREHCDRGVPAISLSPGVVEKGLELLSRILSQGTVGAYSSFLATAHLHLRLLSLPSTAHSTSALVPFEQMGYALVHLTHVRYSCLVALVCIACLDTVASYTLQLRFLLETGANYFHLQELLFFQTSFPYQSTHTQGVLHTVQGSWLGMTLLMGAGGIYLTLTPLNCTG